MVRACAQPPFIAFNSHTRMFLHEGLTQACEDEAEAGLHYCRFLAVMCSPSEVQEGFIKDFGEDRVSVIIVTQVRPVNKLQGGIMHMLSVIASIWVPFRTINAV